ncbi:MAG: flagellar basal body P-ring formation chaperone FlgA, partial [Usitatibacteraceae bacterium]
MAGPLRCCLLALACVSAVPVCWAATRESETGAPPIAADDSIEALLARETASLLGRVEIVVGQLDSRIVLTPCAKIEPFLPAGTRAWGRIKVGMRCKEGAGWTVFLPVTVKVFGTALTAKKSLMSGAIPADNDVELGESELSREPGMPVTDLKQVEGKMLARSLFPGQILRMENFRKAPAISQGDQVKLLATGRGFTISVDGEALSHALDGQSIRVKTDAGRIVSGIARPGR